MGWGYGQMIELKTVKRRCLDAVMVVSISGVLISPFPAPNWYKVLGFSSSGFLLGGFVVSKQSQARLAVTLKDKELEHQKALDEVEQYLVEAQGELTSVKGRLVEVESALIAKAGELEKVRLEKDTAYLHIDNLEEFITNRIKNLE